MIRFSVCLEFFFDDKPIEERIAPAREAGFEAGELWHWKDRDLDAIRRAADQNDFRITSICAMEPIPGFNDRSRHAELRQLVTDALGAAAVLGCPQLIVMGGTSLDGVAHEEQIKAVVDGLGEMGEAAAKRDMVLVLELLNSKKAFPGYLIDNTADQFDVVRRIGNDGVRAVYDLFHAGTMEGANIDTIRDNIEWISSFQIAGVPDRDEPFRGEINYPGILAELRRLAFDGYVALEYVPSLESHDSLARTMEWLTAVADGGLPTTADERT